MNVTETQVRFLVFMTNIMANVTDWKENAMTHVNVNQQDMLIYGVILVLTGCLSAYISKFVIVIGLLLILGSIAHVALKAID